MVSNALGDLSSSPLPPSLPGQDAHASPTEIGNTLRQIEDAGKTQGLSIDKNGMVEHERILDSRQPTIERAPMKPVKGIVVHQTDSPTVNLTLNSYARKDAKGGAHFLIDKDGTIHQTASLNKQAPHVGKLQSRCAAEQKCPKPKFDPPKTHNTEKIKAVPDRYPSNEDSIGIELVGQAFPLGEEARKKKEPKFELVTKAQNESLRWLVGELRQTYKIPESEVFQHPIVSYKNPTEASTAEWK
jgi:N-acetyl-anhydromuramyl-L-alanine amidase AmpD